MILNNCERERESQQQMKAKEGCKAKKKVGRQNL